MMATDTHAQRQRDLKKPQSHAQAPLIRNDRHTQSGTALGRQQFVCGALLLENDERKDDNEDNRKDDNDDTNLLSPCTRLVVLGRLEFLRGFLHEIGGLRHAELNAVDHFALALHQDGHVQEELVKFFDALFQLENVLVSVLDVLQRLLGLCVACRKDLLGKYVATLALENLLHLICSRIRLDNFELALDAVAIFLFVVRLDLVVLRHDFNKLLRQYRMLYRGNRNIEHAGLYGAMWTTAFKNIKSSVSAHSHRGTALDAAPLPPNSRKGTHWPAATIIYELHTHLQTDKMQQMAEQKIHSMHRSMGCTYLAFPDAHVSTL
eukprot:Opistho-2@26758